jgi:hypothetical protein
VSEPEPPADAEPPAHPEEQPEQAEVVEERRYPSTLGGAFYLGVLLATAVGMGLVYQADDWRLGVRVVAGALVAAAACRLLLPQRDAGMLAVRHRLVDVFLLLLVGVGLFFLAGTIPDRPPI